MKFALFLGNAGKNSGGPEVYELELLRSLAAIDRKNDYHVYFLFPQGPEKAGKLPANFTCHLLKPSIRSIILSTTLPLALRRLNADAVHSTFVPPLFIPPRMAYTLPCTSVFEHPEYYPVDIRLRLRLLCGIGIRSSQNVMCISEHVRDWVADHLGHDAERLPIVPLAASRAFRPMSETDWSPIVKEKYGINSPYFLFSGRWEERKNILRIIEAFAQFKRETKSDAKLVLTGERTWAAEKVKVLLERLAIRDSFVDLGKSPLSDLPSLYAGALALLYPSLWESFGLPIVEAMQCGTPVITSNRAAMPETAGGAALLVDPYKTEELSHAMGRLSADGELRGELQKRGLQRAEYFSWERTAERSLQVYQRLASRN
jgi:glycosyltransferase involved in cell wall biosynthesis